VGQWLSIWGRKGLRLADNSDASLVDYPEIARSVGLDPDKMLERVRLPRSCLRNPDLRISADAVAELLEASG